MMASITWKEFIACISLIVALYYVVIVALYFRKDLMLLRFSSLKKYFSGLHFYKAGNAETPAFAKTLLQDEASKTQTDGNDAAEDQLHTLNRLLEELGQQITVAGEQQFVKEELFFSIESILKRFSNLRYSADVQTINNYIQDQVENNCSIHLSEEEISALWK